VGLAVTEDTDLIAGRYRLIAWVGSGGMGVVWRAKDEVLGRTVAVKALVSGSAADGAGIEQDARRVMREARIGASLHHPNVIGVYDVVEHDGRPYLVMEYLESRSLSEMLSEGSLLAPHGAARVGAQVAAALVAAHQAGIVHRDVKPGNVLIARDGTVKLSDFGISRAVGDTTVTGSGVLLGTIAYIAPEVGRGQSADSRSDVYSLGATLYAALEGEPPSGTSDNAIALLYRIVHEDIAPPRKAGALSPILLWMLERDPDRRPTMALVQRSLESLQATTQDSAAEPTKPARTEPVGTAGGTANADPAEPTAAAEATTTEAGGSEPAPSKGGERPRRLAFSRRTRALAIALVATGSVATGAVILALQLGGHHGPAAALSASTGRAGATLGSTPAISPTPVDSRGAAPSTSAPAVLPTSQSLADQLKSAIVDYYQLMPGNLDQGWNRMTDVYRQNHAGGRGGYQSFWGQIQRVALSDVEAQPPSTVVATIDYTYKNGSLVEERTSFGLVFQNGAWKIASSSVLSSRTL
jgi:hypothetical protein